ncbi:MAG: hypothetical protein F4Y68_13510 [Boseongicola sp. SB0665_bin_10]|nr:hypothetical protein [Boseongicola sp. SB0665_bin_10]
MAKGGSKSSGGGSGGGSTSGGGKGGSRPQPNDGRPRLRPWQDTSGSGNVRHRAGRWVDGKLGGDPNSYDARSYQTRQRMAANVDQGGDGPRPASAGARPGGDRIMDNVVERPPGVIAQHDYAAPDPQWASGTGGLLGRIGDVTASGPDMGSFQKVGVLDPSKLPGVRKTDFGSLPGIRKTDFDALPGVRKTDFGSLPGVQIDPRDYTNLEAELGNRQQGYQGLLGDLQGLRDERGRIADRLALSGPDDFGAEREAVSSAMYERAMNLRRADDERAQSDLENRLWQKGLAPGSEAYNEELNRLQQGRDRAMNDLSLASVMAGAQEHQRLADLTSRNRAQEFGEAAGIFDRGGQTFDRGQQVFDSQSVMQNFQDQAQRDKFAQTMGLRGLLGQEGQQRFGQDIALRGLLGQEGQQRYDQDTGWRSQLQGEGRDRFDQDMGFRGQRFNEEQARFNQELAKRQQDFAEMQYSRQEPFGQVSQLAGLLGMPSYAAPQYSAPDIVGMTGSNYAARANAAAQRTGGLLGLAGSLGGALLSDRRAKENIRAVGRLHNGLAVYVFNYKGHDTPQIGLMADEVEQLHPDAVRELNGVKHVDYELAAA